MKVVCICLVFIAAVADASRFKKGTTDITKTSSGAGAIELSGYGSTGLVCKTSDDAADSVANVAKCANGYQYIEKSSLDSSLQSTEWSIELSCSDGDTSLNDCSRSEPLGFAACGTFVGCA